jgi:hypothetical protein
MLFIYGSPSLDEYDVLEAGVTTMVEPCPRHPQKKLPRCLPSVFCALSQPNAQARLAASLAILRNSREAEHFLILWGQDHWLF